jgi:mevalonate kinase
MSHIGLGKIILLGEHAVVYGYPALAAALDRGVSVSVVPTPAGGSMRIDIPSWQLKLTADDDHSFAQGLCAITDEIGLGRPPLTLVGDAQIPPGAGLGASAAFAVAISRALLTHLKQPTDVATVTRVAGASETVLHGRASGVDVAVAIQGGVGVFRTASGLRPIKIAPLRVIVGPSGSPRSTSAMVERVSQAVRANAEDERLHELGALTDTGTTALVRGELGALGATMNRAHELLSGLGVSTPLLDGLCNVARTNGALGAKLTGAGGGGAIIAIAPRDREADILAAWKTAGVSGFVATIQSR